MSTKTCCDRCGMVVGGPEVIGSTRLTPEQPKPDVAAQIGARGIQVGFYDVREAGATDPVYVSYDLGVVDLCRLCAGEFLQWRATPPNPPHTA